MIQMKTKEEIGQYLSTKIKEKSLSQSDLARQIAEMRGSGFNKNSRQCK